MAFAVDDVIKPARLTCPSPPVWSLVYSLVASDAVIVAPLAAVNNGSRRLRAGR
jgi:hypothetical protein